MKLYQHMFSNSVWVIEPQEIDHGGYKLWHICQTCNLCGKELYKKFPIYASNVIGLNDRDIRSYVSGLAEFCINKHLKFDFTNKHLNFDCTNEIEKKLARNGLDERMMTHLLDLRDQEWQHIDFEEQLVNLRNQMFQNLFYLVLQMHLENGEHIEIFFLWQNLSRPNKRSGFDPPARSQSRKPRYASIVSLGAKKTYN